MSFGILHRLALVRTDVSKTYRLHFKDDRTSSYRWHGSRRTGRQPLATIPPQLCLSVTMETLLIGRWFMECVWISLPTEGYYVKPKNAAFWDEFTVVTITNLFWDIAPCGCSKNGRFGEHTASILRWRWRWRRYVLWNVGFYKNHMASHLRRRYSS
jgi:hypothetical protein